MRQETPPPPRVWTLIIIGDEGERMFRVSRKVIREICTKFWFIVTAGSLLRNRRTHPLTRAMIDNAVRDLWQQSGDPRDFLLVWYAGHGSGSWSFALWDNLDITPYPLFDLLATNTHFHQITVISDCCASGSITDDLRRWIASPEGQASMRGRRILTHYHASEGYTESAGFFTTINYGGGLAEPSTCTCDPALQCCGIGIFPGPLTRSICQSGGKMAFSGIPSAALSRYLAGEDTGYGNRRRK